jgi:hypothetical protein
MGRVYFDKAKGQGAVRIGAYASLVDGNHIHIDDKIYEFDNNASVTEGAIAVTIGGSNTATALALKNAINANPPTHAVVAAIDSVDDSVVNLTATYGGPAGNVALSATMTGASNIVSGAALTGGESDGNQKLARGTYEVTALDVAAGRVLIETSRSGPRFKQLDFCAAGGTPLYVTGQVTIAGGKLLYTFDDGSGGVNPEAGDTVDWQVYE